MSLRIAWSVPVGEDKLNCNYSLFMNKIWIVSSVVVLPFKYVNNVPTHAKSAAWVHVCFHE